MATPQTSWDCVWTHFDNLMKWFKWKEWLLLSYVSWWVAFEILDDQRWLCFHTDLPWQTWKPLASRQKKGMGQVQRTERHTESEKVAWSPLVPTLVPEELSRSIYTQHIFLRARETEYCILFSAICNSAPAFSNLVESDDKFGYWTSPLLTQTWLISRWKVSNRIRPLAMGSSPWHCCDLGLHDSWFVDFRVQDRMFLYIWAILSHWMPEAPPPPAWQPRMSPHIVTSSMGTK